MYHVRMLLEIPQVSYTGARMDIEQTIADIERLEHMISVPDTRPLSPSDISAANRKHDEKLAHSPWFRLWQHYGVCCRGDAKGGAGLIV
jgi:hypothetical protein